MLARALDGFAPLTGQAPLTYACTRRGWRIPDYCVYQCPICIGTQHVWRIQSQRTDSGRILDPTQNSNEFQHSKVMAIACHCLGTSQCMKPSDFSVFGPEDRERRSPVLLLMSKLSGHVQHVTLDQHRPVEVRSRKNQKEEGRDR
ncbi:uncharacterized protein K489DRAFT_179466 [Dissoconium aciculare CBS 342.82]|uniref:Uncharacterized protein n=1 Tax=Dissoconium aciculare CBS 342.82 TaxID=1314786 RepID=A0A6J3M8I5_9PEZI|nr:uncharacterized protein K489DRAFT_179466 [Dissoconium aciculare CBS 342.82]KAF1824305.1 hypothetical protein K489DRAFT_179466 [Dissoconium aciculare CBS 342.82]